MKIILFLAGLMFVLSSGISFANEPAVAQSCKGDVEKLCKGVEHGQGRILKCLKEHEDQLSAECKAAGQAAKSRITEKRAERRKELQTCKDDFLKFCKGVVGPLKRLSCLKERESEVSPSCKDALQKTPNAAAQ